MQSLNIGGQVLIITNEKLKPIRECLWQQIQCDIKGWGINQDIIEYSAFEIYDDEYILTVKLS